jgi:arylsulfatase A
MARHGINFTHCESTPLCCTSRSILLTGKYLNRNYSNWGYMNAGEKTIGNVMKDAGYTTEIFGKLQFQYSPQQMQDWGWDKHILFELTEDTMAYRRYKNPVLRENGYRIPDSLMAGKYCDDVLTGRVLDFIDSNKNKKPFFAYYCMSIGHDPFCPTPDDPEFAAWNPKSPSNPKFYPSMMKYMDKLVGTILNKLKSAHIENKTIVIFAGDNGTPVSIFYNAHGETHIQGEKGKTMEGGTHVPMIVYWPGHVQQGSINDDLVDFADFLPTLAQAGRLKDLSGYGQLDGISFYPKILGRKGVKKKQLYCFYDPENLGKDSLKTWERNKDYKLYDSTGIAKSGKFYNIINDPEELSPLADDQLNTQEKRIKNRFENILDTSYSWPDCPGITKPTASKITSTTVTLSAVITSSGASALIERGSCLSTQRQIFLSSNRLRDYNVQLGKYTVKRTGLKPQTAYAYVVYAMNENLSHSTGTVQSKFTTLSQPALKQPTEFTISEEDTTYTASWDNAVFPSSGATKGGYVIVYSSAVPSIKKGANGNAPENIAANGKTIVVPSVALPTLPKTKIALSSLPKDRNYNFLLIPYTWDGHSAETYNYFISGALKARLSNIPFAMAEKKTNNINRSK